MTPRDKVVEALGAIRKLVPVTPDLVMVLGSGVGDFVRVLDNPVSVPYEEIPWWPRSTAPGHAGVLHVGRLGTINVAVLQGRVHYYEGYSMEEVVFPVRVMGEWGAKVFVATNASGGIDRSYSPGQWVLIEDHINLMGANPLVGPNEDFWGVRFPDMTEAYDRDLMRLMERAASRIGVALGRGVYVAMSGPSFETPAEIRMLSKLGGTLVGMSTVPEVIAARHMGLRVLALSCVANYAAGISPNPLTHEEVLREVSRATGDLCRLLPAFLEEMSNEI
ncbi:inosine guanosine and xanthosine phosphorylase family [Thermanaerovibrio acidaminovorans DSM 6589]|uniref:Purine nucleoside phosphorylase n=1 Tax=Thermanaerovibrio acidaminovorans (strain ATCC 49978 / DSM 6589 / Su883) TaxID=525903 RepID=D1B5G3_THEAS|nr:purine-nucleoside phosphorylase [Thermanaerovibrio acidaminovorans]ACZ19254.1 inosine guanosine and xanthosine phosphorylase family [Thermanaerovibrio acidaminovorans DSM 6589]